MLIKGLPSVREEGATSPHLKHVSIKLQIKGEGAISLHHGLRPQEGATSPRGAHLPIPTCSNQMRYVSNQLPISLILSPLTI